jgi:hypothetical protein
MVEGDTHISFSKYEDLAESHRAAGESIYNNFCIQLSDNYST